MGHIVGRNGGEGIVEEREKKKREVQGQIIEKGSYKA